MARVTVVNDNPEFLELVGEILNDERYAVSLIDGDDPDATKRVAESHPDLLIIDVRLGAEHLRGWDIAQHVRRDASMAAVPILLVSADVVALAEVEDQLDDTHITAVLSKPFQVDELTRTVEKLLGEAAAR